jgi:hypothetical protein
MGEDGDSGAGCCAKAAVLASSDNVAKIGVDFLIISLLVETDTPS